MSYRSFVYLHLIPLCLICGCITAQKIGQEKARPVFYPAQPEEPRIQFLTSISTSDDLEWPPNVFKKFIVGKEKDAQPIVKPYGVAVYDHKIYICDTVAHAIVTLDLKIRKFEYFRPREESRLAGPINLSFDRNGNMYVADSLRGQVIIFDPNGNTIDLIGKKSEFKPASVLVKDDKIYVCDLKTHSVRVYGLEDRQLLSTIPQEGAPEEARLFSPTNIAIDEERNLYVSDTGAFRVQKYGPNGEFLMSIGSYHYDPSARTAMPRASLPGQKALL